MDAKYPILDKTRYTDCRTAGVISVFYTVLALLRVMHRDEMWFTHGFTEA